MTRLLVLLASSLCIILLTGNAQAQNAGICIHYEEGGPATLHFGYTELDIEWIEVVTPLYTICRPQSVEHSDVNYVMNILNNAHPSIDARYELKDIKPVIYLFSELRPDHGAAPWISTNFSVRDDIWMVYLAPSNPAWDNWGGGIMRHSIQDYHTRVLSNEYFEMLHDIESPAPRWMHQGLSWYNGLFWFLDGEQTAPKLARLVRDDNSLFMTIRRDVKSLGTDSVYAGGAAILQYLEGRFEGIHIDLINHQHDSFDTALSQGIIEKGSTVEFEYEGMLHWVDECSKGKCDIEPFTPHPEPEPITSPPIKREPPSYNELCRAYYRMFTPPLPGPLSYLDCLASKLEFLIQN